MNSATTHLRDLLDQEEPRFIRWMNRTWKTQGALVDNAFVTNAIINGGLSASQIDAWRAEYVEFINEHVGPAWQVMMEGGADAAGSMYLGVDGAIIYNRHEQLFAQLMAERGGELIVNLTNQQAKAVNTILKAVGVDGKLGVESTAKYIRAAVGLTEREANAVAALRASLIADGVPLAKVQRAVLRQSSLYHRKRSLRIARTELAQAYGNALRSTMQAEVELGNIAVESREWNTADDELTCDVCRPLNNVKTTMASNYVSPETGLEYSHPPAHIQCRCTELYHTRSIIDGT